jgi:flagellar biogenesis protein FliO
MSILRNFSSNSLFMFTSMQTRPKRFANGFVGLAGLGALFHRVFPNLGRRSAFGGALEHLGSLPLTAHSSLALVRLYKETLLLGITPQSITLLSKESDEGAFAPDRMNTEPIALREEPLSQMERPAR